MSWTGEAQQSPVTDSNPSSELAGLAWPASTDLLAGEFMPSRLLQEANLNFLDLDVPRKAASKDNASERDGDDASKKSEGREKKESKSASQVSWLSLFAELDPLESQNEGGLSAAVDRA